MLFTTDPLLDECDALLAELGYPDPWLADRLETEADIEALIEESLRLVPDEGALG